jgi:predicted RNA-binding Zn-ribbon protein involved in translation (DUF1610 family)
MKIIKKKLFDSVLVPHNVCDVESMMHMVKAEENFTAFMCGECGEYKTK